MKIGIISDIHGNLPALKVILDKFQKEQCDYIYCLGDVVAIGPFSKECIELLLEQPNIKFVRGNHEEYFIGGISNLESHPMSDGERKHQAFIASSLDEEIKKVISTFPYLIQENIEGINVAFVHYAFEDKGDRKTFKLIEKNVTEENMDRLFEGIEADVVFFGHDHRASDIKGRKHYIDVGSSGCTKDDITHCTIVDFKSQSYDIKVHRMRYDKEDVLKALEERQIPEREFISKVFFS